jgi:nucleotide-binding universal stress UspA family protein
VADGLIRRTPCPVLAVRPKETEGIHLKEMEFRHLLVTLDGSPESDEILPYAQEFSRISGARMTLLRVISPHFPLTSTFVSHSPHEGRGRAEEREAAQASLEEEAEALRAHGFEAEARTVIASHPPEGILTFAAEESVDLIAMATHGRGGVSRFFLGSVSDKVIRAGAIPVLLHRAP